MKLLCLNFNPVSSSNCANFSQRGTFFSENRFFHDCQIDNEPESRAQNDLHLREGKEGIKAREAFLRFDQMSEPSLIFQFSFQV